MQLEAVVHAAVLKKATYASSWQTHFSMDADCAKLRRQNDLCYWVMPT